jgi:hypothetical protein
MSHPPPDPARPPLSRRAALGAMGLSLAGLAGAALPRWARALDTSAEHEHCGSGGPRSAVEHPEPRPGITADAILPDDKVRERSRDVYAKAREIPEILDGIYCHCDCAQRHDLRSLLACFESTMAAGCGICAGQAKLAHRLHGQGKSLDEIRAAIDKQYGE